MRNSGFLKKIDEDSMRNTYFKNVSHNVLLWLYVLYLKSMSKYSLKSCLCGIFTVYLYRNNRPTKHMQDK